MEQLINNVDSLVLVFVQAAFGGLSGTIQTLWHMMFIIFIAVYGYKTIISGRFSAPDLITHCIKIIVILIIATQWDVFFLFIYDMTTDLPSDVAGQILIAADSSLGSSSQAYDETSVNAALSNFFNRGMAVSTVILEGAKWSDFGQYLYATAIWFGTIGVSAYAAMLIILAKLAVAILLTVGPFFILLFIFNDTKSLFEGWLRTLLSYAIVPIFVYTLLALILYLVEAPLASMETNTDTYAALVTFIAPFLLTTIISMLLLAQVLNITSSITGGLSISTMGTAAWSAGTSSRLAKSGLWATGKGGFKAGKWGWNKSAAPRKRMGKSVSNGISAGRKALSNALKRNRGTS